MNLHLSMSVFLGLLVSQAFSPSASQPLIQIQIQMQIQCVCVCAGVLVCLCLSVCVSVCLCLCACPFVSLCVRHLCLSPLTFF